MNRTTNTIPMTHPILRKYMNSDRGRLRIDLHAKRNIGLSRLPDDRSRDIWDEAMRSVNAASLKEGRAEKEETRHLARLLRNAGWSYWLARRWAKKPETAEWAFSPDSITYEVFGVTHNRNREYSA